MVVISFTPGNEIDMMICQRFEDLEADPTLRITWDKIILAGIRCYERASEEADEVVVEVYI